MFTVSINVFTTIHKLVEELKEQFHKVVEGFSTKTTYKYVCTICFFSVANRHLSIILTWKITSYFITKAVRLKSEKNTFQKVKTTQRKNTFFLSITFQETLTTIKKCMSYCALKHFFLQNTAFLLSGERAINTYFFQIQFSRTYKFSQWSNLKRITFR